MRMDAHGRVVVAEPLAAAVTIRLDLLCTAWQFVRAVVLAYSDTIYREPVSYTDTFPDVSSNQDVCL